LIRKILLLILLALFGAGCLQSPPEEWSDPLAAALVLAERTKDPDQQMKQLTEICICLAQAGRIEQAGGNSRELDFLQKSRVWDAVLERTATEQNLSHAITMLGPRPTDNLDNMQRARRVILLCGVAKIDEPPEALNALLDALPSPSERIPALYTLTTASRRQGSLSQRAEALKAQTEALGAEATTEKEFALLAAVWAQLGDNKNARNSAQKSKKAVAAAPEDEVLGAEYLVEAQLRTEGPEQPLRTARAMEDSERGEILGLVAGYLAEQGKTSEALALAELIENPFFRGPIFKETGLAQIAAGDLDGAATTLEPIPLDSSNDQLIDAYLDQDDPSGAAKVIQRIENSTTPGMEDPDIWARINARVAAHYTQAGMWDQAFRLAEQATPSDLPGLLAAIGVSCARRNLTLPATARASLTNLVNR
jgi:hypothetical protein